MAMNVPFLDLSAGYRELKTEIDDAVASVLTKGVYILGEEVEAFESEYAQYCETKYAVGVADGLDGLHLSLLALGVGVGDEVIVPSHTYIATWLAVSQVGATIVPVEPRMDTFNIDVDAIEAAITPRTKVIVPVHLYGQPADLDPIMALAQKHGLFVLEDAAQCHGARYKGRRIGGHGHVVSWSFYPGKNLGAFGDGGCVTTNDAGLADRLRVLRNYGSRQRYNHEVIGYNSRLDPLQAAMLRVKLRHLDEWNGRRQAIALRYQQAFCSTSLIPQSVPIWAEPVWHLFVIRSSRRDELQAALAQNGVTTLIHYPVAPHMQGAYRHLFPHASELADGLLSLPIGPHFSAPEIEHVITVTTRACSELAA
jgi:dTDP-4-amino-4,6-dideoxygalactose transaminase